MANFDPMPGFHQNAEIISHEFKRMGQKQTPLLEILVQLGEGQRVPVRVWMTDKSMGMARRALKLCGFDPDRHTMAELDTNPTLLAGVRIPEIDVEVHEQYGASAQVVLGGNKVEPKALDEITAKLRAVKQDEDEPDVSAKGTPSTPPVEPGGGTQFDDIPFI